MKLFQLLSIVFFLFLGDCVFADGDPTVYIRSSKPKRESPTINTFASQQDQNRSPLWQSINIPKPNPAPPPVIEPKKNASSVDVTSKAPTVDFKKNNPSNEVKKGPPSEVRKNPSPTEVKKTPTQTEIRKNPPTEVKKRSQSEVKKSVSIEPRRKPHFTDPRRNNPRPAIGVHRSRSERNNRKSSDTQKTSARNNDRNNRRPDVRKVATIDSFLPPWANIKKTPAVPNKTTTWENEMDKKVAQAFPDCVKSFPRDIFPFLTDVEKRKLQKIQNRVPDVDKYLEKIIEKMRANPTLKWLPKQKNSRTGRKCIVVGNSPALYAYPVGRRIDNHDLVIRLNHDPTVGYESMVGRKTDVRIFYRESPAKFFENEKEADRTSAILTVLSRGSRVNGLEVFQPQGKNETALFDRYKDRLRILNPMIPSEAKCWLKTASGTQTWPSSAMFAVTLATHLCDVVNIAGFSILDRQDKRWYPYYKIKKGSKEASETIAALRSDNPSAERKLLGKLLRHKIVKKDYLEESINYQRKNKAKNNNKKDQRKRQDKITKKNNKTKEKTSSKESVTNVSKKKNSSNNRRNHDKQSEVFSGDARGRKRASHQKHQKDVLRPRSSENGQKSEKNIKRRAKSENGKRTDMNNDNSKTSNGEKKDQKSQQNAGNGDKTKDDKNSDKSQAKQEGSSPGKKTSDQSQNDNNANKNEDKKQPKGDPEKSRKRKQRDGKVKPEKADKEDRFINNDWSKVAGAPWSKESQSLNEIQQQDQAIISMRDE